MKGIYETPQMYAESFVANQYIAACKEPIYNVTPTDVRCMSPGHDQTQVNVMFLDSQDACIAKFNPGVGEGHGDKFYTQFEACAYVQGCNRQNWMAAHPGDTDLSQHRSEHGSGGMFIFGCGREPGEFIMHDTVIDLSLAEKYQLS